ncbi:MAG TPA: polysaccharide deacetylase family protein [Solirubrobacteraceae bacterium]|nr:polysaccharide deacetylase family protein [Solirubrobacteraceae bacterium]
MSPPASSPQSATETAGGVSPAPRSRRDRAAALLAKPVLRSIARRLPRWRGVVVLNYHRIGTSDGQPWDRTLWNADAESFDAQLATLARHADVLAPQDAERFAREDRPGRRVLLTFDDGYRDNYEIAYPLLRRHGLTATFFPATGFLDRVRAAWWDELAWMVRHATRERIPAGDPFPYALSLGPEQDGTIAALAARYKELSDEDTEPFLVAVAAATGAGRCEPSHCRELWMTWEMLRELQAAGMQIGGHTVTHPILARLPLERQREEIDGCAERLEQELGRPMSWFAYPVGARDSFTAQTQQLLAERGVRLAFSFYGGFASYARWNALDVPRIHVSASHGPELLQAMLWLPRLLARW